MQPIRVDRNAMVLWAVVGIRAVSLYIMSVYFYSTGFFVYRIVRHGFPAESVTIDVIGQFVVAAVIAAALWLFARPIARKMVPDLAGRCPNCSYSLEKQATNTCPECGLDLGPEFQAKPEKNVDDSQSASVSDPA